MKTLLRSFGRILTLVGLASLAWLLINWWAGKPIEQLQILGLLVLVLGLTLLRVRPEENLVRQRFLLPARGGEAQTQILIESGKN